MQHQWDNGIAVLALIQDVLLSASHTNQNWVNSFQVGRVRGQGDLDFAVAEHLQVLALST